MPLSQLSGVLSTAPRVIGSPNYPSRQSKVITGPLPVGGSRFCRRRFWQGRFWRAALLGLGLAAFAASPGAAAERIVLRVGPLRQAIELRDLEDFAQTGEVPEALRLYERFLSPQVQTSLQQELDLDPSMSDRIIEDVIDSPNGELLLNTLAQVAPNVSMPQLQAAIRLAAMQGDGLSVLGILRAVPQDTLEVDLTSAIALISQLNFATVESRSLSSVIDQALTVENPSAPLPTDIDPAALGPVEPSFTSVSVRDEARDRTIPINIYWSQNVSASELNKLGPLVVLSHGFGSDRYFLDYLAQHLASYGLTVVSIEHPGSNVQALIETQLDPEIAESPNRLLPATEFLDRPRDVSFVLDRLAQANNSNAAYQGAFNTEEVTMIGHSLGGYTGLALAGAKLDLRSLQNFCQNIDPLGVSPADWLQCAAVELPEQQADLSDARIKQVMAMNTLSGQLFGEAGLSGVTVPTLLLTGTQDGVTPTLDHQLEPFEQLSGPKYLLAVIGGTHLSTGDPDNVNPALSELPFMSELPSAETESLRQMLRGVALSFVEQRSPEAEQYKPFLSAAYVQSFSTPTLPLRFAQTLPESLRSWLSLTDNLSPDQTPALADKLLSLSYLKTLENQEQLQKAVAVHLQGAQVATVLRSPFPFILGR
jgi:predicted dienelactone hydrolase